MIVLGADVLVYLKGTDDEEVTLIGGQRGASLQISRDTIETTTKETGIVRSYVAGLASWSVSCDALVIDNETSFGLFGIALLEGTAMVELEIRIGDMILTGDAVITSYSLDAPYDAEATYSVSFQGSGALTLGEDVYF